MMTPELKWQNNKHYLQRIIALLAIVCLSPLLLILAVVVRMTSPGSPIYRQKRSGQGGAPYLIMKLRSMYIDAEARTGATWSPGKTDPRITPVGLFLRLSHLDELPQLWNIVRGQMAFVGPRPERPEILEELSKDIENLDDRLAVKPGLTGLAQIQQPSDQTVECFRRKLEYDRLYIKNRSVWLDLRIIFGTVLYLMGFSYALVRILCFLPKLDEVTEKNLSYDPAPPGSGSSIAEMS
jgi:lipopolysaccharide/colanic/teichoic acid biosynthesis glycosyltransferase